MHERISRIILWASLASFLLIAIAAAAIDLAFPIVAIRLYPVSWVCGSYQRFVDRDLTEDLRLDLYESFRMRVNAAPCRFARIALRRFLQGGMRNELLAITVWEASLGTPCVKDIFSRAFFSPTCPATARIKMLETIDMTHKQAEFNDLLMRASNEMPEEVASYARDMARAN